MAKVTVWYSQKMYFSEVIEYDTSDPNWRDNLSREFNDAELELPIHDPVSEEMSIDDIHEGEV